MEELIPGHQRPDNRHLMDIKPMEPNCYPSAWYSSLSWKGYNISYIFAPVASKNNGEGENDKGTIVLIHGFGACKEHWRHNVEELRLAGNVLAIDLIGFGASDKPKSRLADEEQEENNFYYGIDAWAEQITDIIINHTEGRVQLIGNSIGGVVSLAVADRLERMERPAENVILIDCAQRALDDKRLAEQPPFRRIARPVLKLAVRQRWLTSAIFSAVAKPGIIRRVLAQAYPTEKNVDDQLVSLLLKPALGPGSKESFRGFINLFQDRIAPEFLERLKTPVTLIWGQQDPWEPIVEARRWVSYPCVRELYELERVGHCPHDETPEEVNKILLSVLHAVGQSR